MSEWKTFEEILPEIGQLMADDPEFGYERVERRWREDKKALLEPTNWNEVFLWEQEAEYRIKPRTVTRTVTYPEPLREKPKCGESYWTINNPLYDVAARLITWEDDQIDKWAFERGMCFATKADAKAAFDALFGGE